MGSRQVRQDSSLPAPQSAPIQVVLPGQAVGWAAIEKAVRDFDEQQVQDYKEDIDTLLTFAGLFSAALTALLALSYSLLQPDSAGDTVLLLRQIQYQTAPNIHYQGPVMNITDLSPPSPPPFEPSLAAIRVNALWFASLICSLATASIGILVKQWLREYMAVRMTTSAHGRLRVRQFRAPGLDTWKVFEIAASLPLLIQLALALFFIGLCIFTADADPTLGRATLPLVIAWAIFFFIVTICPIISARCPYKTPILIKPFSTIRKWLYSTLYRLIGPPIIFYNSRFTYSGMLLQLARLWIQRRTTGCAEEHRPYSEHDAVTYHDKDLDILASADALQTNDEMLGTVFLDALKQSNLELDIVIAFLRRVVRNRLGLYVDEIFWENQQAWLLGLMDCQPLSRQTGAAIADTLAHSCGDALITAANKGLRNNSCTWAMCFLLSLAPDAVPPSAHQLLARCLTARGTSGILAEAINHQSDRSISATEGLRILLDAICVACREMDVGLSNALKCLTDALDIYFFNLRLPACSVLPIWQDDLGNLYYDWWETFCPDSLNNTITYLSTMLSLELRKPQDLPELDHAKSMTPTNSSDHSSSIYDRHAAILLIIRLRMLANWSLKPKKNSVASTRRRQDNDADIDADNRVLKELLTADLASVPLVEALLLGLMHQPFSLLKNFLKKASFVCDAKALHCLYDAVKSITRKKISGPEATWSALHLCYITARLLRDTPHVYYFHWYSQSSYTAFVDAWRWIFDSLAKLLHNSAANKETYAPLRSSQKRCIEEICDSSVYHTGLKLCFSGLFLNTLLRLHPAARTTERWRYFQLMTSAEYATAVDDDEDSANEPKFYARTERAEEDTADGESRDSGEPSIFLGADTASDDDGGHPAFPFSTEGDPTNGLIVSHSNGDLLGTTLIFLNSLDQSRPKWQDVVVLSRNLLCDSLDPIGSFAQPTLMNCQCLSPSARAVIIDIIAQRCGEDITTALSTPVEPADQDHATWAICILLSISRSGVALPPNAVQLLRRCLTNTDVLDSLAITSCRATSSATTLHILLETVHHVCSEIAEDLSGTFKCLIKIFEGYFKELKLPPSSSPCTVWTSALEKNTENISKDWTIVLNDRSLQTIVVHLTQMLRIDLQNNRSPLAAIQNLKVPIIPALAPTGSAENTMHDYIRLGFILIRLYAMSDEWKKPGAASRPDDESSRAMAMHRLVDELVAADFVSAPILEVLLLGLMHQRFYTMRSFVRSYLTKSSPIFRKPAALCLLDGAVKAVTQHTVPDSEVENILNLCYIVVQIFECCYAMALAQPSSLRSQLFRTWRCIFDHLGRRLQRIDTKTEGLSEAHTFGIDTVLLTIHNVDTANIRYESDYDGYLAWLNTLNPAESLFSDSFVHSLLRHHPDAVVTWRIRRVGRRKPLPSLSPTVEGDELATESEESHELLDDEFSLLRRPSRPRILSTSSTIDLTGHEEPDSDAGHTKYNGSLIDAIIYGSGIQPKSASSSAQHISGGNTVVMAKDGSDSDPSFHIIHSENKETSSDE